MTASKNYGYEPNYGLDTFDPNIYQGYSNTCAIRSQEIILRDYGIMLSQDELIAYATQNGWFSPDPVNGGTDKNAVGNILDACGIHTTRTENATIYDIISELRAGHRVIVSVDANELWIKKESNLFKKIFGEIANKASDSIQNLEGIEGVNHALIVAGVNVNPNNPSDIKVALIDSGTGDVCIEYSFKDFHNAWKDGHCQMISTNTPAPYQYNYHTRQMEPSGFDTEYMPSMIDMPVGLNNYFVLGDNFYEAYRDFVPPCVGECFFETNIETLSFNNAMDRSSDIGMEDETGCMSYNADNDDETDNPFSVHFNEDQFDGSVGDVNVLLGKDTFNDENNNEN